MQTIYGNNDSGQEPDIITYFHSNDKSGTVGFWDDKGRLYSVSKFKSSSSDFRLDDYPDAKHIMLVSNSSGQLIESLDFEESKKAAYFSYHQGTEGSILKSELAVTSQVVLFKQLQTPNIVSGAKCPKHILQAIGLSQSPTATIVGLLNCGGNYHLVNVINGKISNYMSFRNNLKIEEIQYKILAFYQEYKIDPNTTLRRYGVESKISQLLGNHLPSLESLKVPADNMASNIDDHIDIYPHYLAFVCVL